MRATTGHISVRIAQLAQLAPDIVEACVAGEDNGLALEHLIWRALPAEWGEQHLEFVTGMSAQQEAALRDFCQ